MSATKVFISYSHDSTDYSKRVLALAWALRDNGIDVELDQFHNEEIVDWPRWQQHFHNRAVVHFCSYTIFAWNNIFIQAHLFSSPFKAFMVINNVFRIELI